ncbi:hypothetical protein [Kitasatospora cineracea]|uniref:Uncharacterized protein n=1 Tax=Kitasatospora cineracea TaxID=88074 RepID=A0A8G1UMF4_9ACTN|nr:hypothetical protein [Kitasatospora cineracea]ROR46500.1 hypothetical protein EDD39_4773 [Kitasatospora cineracea]
MKHLARQLGFAALSAALIAGALAPAASARPLTGSAVSVVQATAPPTATPPQSPLSMEQKREQARKRPSQALPHGPAPAVPRVAGPGMPGYRDLTAAEYVAEYGGSASKPKPGVSGAASQAVADFTGGHPYIENLSF